MSRAGSSRAPAISVKFKETASVPATAEIDLLASLLPQLFEAMVAACAQNGSDLNGSAMDKSISSVEDVAS